jgi:hypothetical protein
MYTTYYTYCGYDSYRGAKCTLPIYKNLEKEAALDAPIRNGEQVSQTFTQFCNKLEMVNVFIKSVPADLQGSLKFSLLDQNQQVAASQDVPVSAILADNYLSLPVTVASSPKGTNYEIRLEAQGLSSQQSVTAGLAEFDYYPGEFTMNGTTTRDDLLIHYTCTTP